MMINPKTRRNYTIMEAKIMNISKSKKHNQVGIA